MLRAHTESHALATLAVQDRESSRYLLFDPQLRLRGRQVPGDQAAEFALPADRSRPLAFSGIHVISPRLLSLMKQEGSFSIIDAYLALAAGGANIMGFRADEYYWRDLGSPASLRQATDDLAQHPLW